MPSHIDDNIPNMLEQDGGMLQNQLVYRRDAASRKLQIWKLIRSKLTVPRCAFTPTRPAHSLRPGTGPSVYRRKRWDIRVKGRLSASLSEVKMAEGKLGANIGGNIGAGAGILAKRFQKSMNRAQEKVGVYFFSSGPWLSCHAALGVYFVCGYPTYLLQNV